MALEPSEIVSYQEHFDRQMISAYRWELWAAAYIIDGGCSDDGFTDFRYGLISRGREVFEAAVANPDSLAEISDDEFRNESFGYVANSVYESQTGECLPRRQAKQPSEPAGEDWDFDDEELCEQKLPRLWAKFDQ